MAQVIGFLQPMGRAGRSSWLLVAAWPSPGLDRRLGRSQQMRALSVPPVPLPLRHIYLFSRHMIKRQTLQCKVKLWEPREE